MSTDDIKKIVQSKKVLVIGNLILGATALCLALYIILQSTVEEKRIVREHNDTYRYTSPILDCENVEVSDEYNISTQSVYNKVEAVKRDYGVSHLSVYFRDLMNGPWIGVGEKESFVPASLFKLPVFIGFYKYSEKNPDILNQVVTVTEADAEVANMQSIKGSHALEVGKEYTLRQVADIMIRESDNVAAELLVKYFPTSYISQLFSSVGVPLTNGDYGTTIRVKDYAGFFRVLYNASYLNRDASEQALAALIDGGYRNALVAGVPQSIPVAHKFGERIMRNMPSTGLVGEIQLHDCGIVYYPKRPYILCVMTRGVDFAKQEQAIKQISTFFYKEVDKMR